jgi:hypothetical protein
MHRSSIVSIALFQILNFLADLSFLLSLKYNEFWIEFFHTNRSHNDLHQDFFCFDFFETCKCHFQNFQKKGLHGARAPFEVSAICVINVLLKQHPMRSHLIIYFKPFSINFTFPSHLSCQTWERMQQEQAPNKDGNRAGLDGYCKTRSKLNPSASPFHAHESIHGYGCCSKSKPTGYPDIHGYPWVYTLCTSL